MGKLSGGEKARALLARVLAGEPRWILADEPLAALDLAHQISLLQVLRAEADKGTGVVLVLHDLVLHHSRAAHFLEAEAVRAWRRDPASPDARGAAQPWSHPPARAGSTPCSPGPCREIRWPCKACSRAASRMAPTWWRWT